MEKRRREKVVCYIVREGHLVTFTHLDVPLSEGGVQVPAGTIEPGESPQDAALREATEETGLTDLRVIRRLGENEYDVTPYRPEIMHRHFYELTTDAYPREPWLAGEPDPDEGEPVAWECRWLPLEKSHVLAAGLGSMIGALFQE